jgi:hypothetical protein
MAFRKSLDIHYSSPTSPAVQEKMFLIHIELGLPVGLKRPLDAAES